MTHPKDFERVLERANEHSSCDEENCFAGDDTWACRYARTLLTAVDRIKELEAERDTYKHEFKMLQAGATRLSGTSGKRG